MKKMIRNMAWVLLSLLAVWAPGMDLTVQRVLRPDAFELGGYLHQAIGRTADAIQTDGITLVFMMAGMLWFTRRYLFRKPENTGMGEYLLCAFFSVMQLLNAAKRQASTVSILYENMFQLLKVALYLPGMFVLLLCAVRGLRELLDWNPKTPKIALWEKHPFLFPFVVLIIVWTPVLLIKYPGALTIDTVLQYRMYVGLEPRSTPHPPFGTLFYGMWIDWARNSNATNLIYFIITFVKTIAFAAVLAYALYTIKQRGVAMWMCLFAFGLFAVSPVYSGWMTVICKDSEYLILCTMTTVLMLEHLGTRRVTTSRWKMVVLAICLILMMLVRHNGVLIAVPLLLIILIEMICQKAGKKQCLRFAAYACAIVVCAFGVKESIIVGMNMKRVSQNDWMSLMFQQTARVVSLHEEEITPQEKELISQMFKFDEMYWRYKPHQADLTRWNMPEDGERSPEDLRAFWKVWWQLFKRYPVDYLDATLHMNGVLFDLQSNEPMYVSLTDHWKDDHVYQDSFNDMSYYNAEQIRPLNGYQRALTEYFYRFSEIPLIGQFASMGFCMELLLVMTYLCWITGRKRALYALLPSLVVASNGLLCAVVYLRYLLPMVAAMPLWLAAWQLCPPENCKLKGSEQA